MKILKSIAIASVALTLSTAPAFAQPRDINMTGTLNLGDGSGSMKEDATNCNYTIDPAVGPFFLMVVHPTPPQPASCRTLTFPEPTTDLFVYQTPIQAQTIEHGEYNFRTEADSTECLDRVGGVLVEGPGNEITDPLSKMTPFRLTGIELFNLANNPACLKVQRH